jgi:hypothetical protein
MCKILEVKPAFFQCASPYPRLSFGVELRKYCPVLSQNIVDVADKIDLFTVLLVVVIIAARIIAKLLVRPPNQRLTA